MNHLKSLSENYQCRVLSFILHPSIFHERMLSHCEHCSRDSWTAEKMQVFPHKVWHCMMPIPANFTNPIWVAYAQHSKPRCNTANLISLLVPLLWEQEESEQKQAIIMTFCNRWEWTTDGSATLEPESHLREDLQMRRRLNYKEKAYQRPVFITLLQWPA